MNPASHPIPTTDHLDPPAPSPRPEPSRAEKPKLNESEAASSALSQLLQAAKWWARSGSR
jgi:hypothetical protein